MAMMISTLAFLFLSGLANCQTKSLQCGELGSHIKPLPTVQFTNALPAQIPPVSSVYHAILTEYMNVVDCDYVLVENIDSNPPQLGEFTAKITIPILTVYRVGCMPKTSTISRRDTPTGYDIEIQAQPTQIPASNAYEKDHQPRSEESENASLGFIFDIADRLSVGIDPTNQNITFRDFKFLVEINTALFALNIVNSVLPLPKMCEYLQNATVQLNLEETFINAKQATSIVCYASVYGLYFNESNAQLLADLALLEYAIQAYTYDSAAMKQVCQDLDYTAASFLGIDTDGIRTYVCNNSGRPAHPPPSNVSVTGGNMTTSNPTSATATLPTNATETSSLSGTVSIIYGTSGSEASSATSAAGTVPMWWNATTSTNSEAATLTSGGQPVSTMMTTHTPHYYPPMLRRRAQAGR